MSIKIVAELPDIFGSTSFTAVCAASGNLYVTTTEPRVRAFNSVTLAVGVSSTSAGAGAPSGIGIINNASAIVVSSGTNQYDFVNLFNGARGQITTNATTTRLAANNQQVACITASGIAVATRSASGGFILINGATFTATPVTVTGMTNEAATCVIVRAPSSTFLLGSNLGVIREVTSAGAILSVGAVPMTNAESPPRKPQILGLVAHGRYVVAATDQGTMFCIDWDDAGRITDMMPIGVGVTATTTISLSNSSSGVFVVPSGGNASTANETFTEVWIDPRGKFVVQDVFVEEINGNPTFGAHVDWENNRAVRLFASTSNQKARLFQISPTNKVDVSTRIQYPLGVDRAGRIIRIRDTGVGSASIELDTTIPASIAYLPATEDKNYIEVALYTDPDPLQPKRWDIREVEA